MDDDEFLTEDEAVRHIMSVLKCSQGEALSQLRAAMKSGEIPAYVTLPDGAVEELDPDDLGSVQ